MAEPGYITDLKDKFDSLSISVTDKFARIETTLVALPEIAEHLEKLNGRVERHEVEIALTKQRQQDCPWVSIAPADLRMEIKANLSSTNGLPIDLSKRSHRFAVGGGLLALLAILVGDMVVIGQAAWPILRPFLAVLGPK